MITVKSVSHDLSLSLQETAHLHNTIEQYSKNPIWNPIYRLNNLFRKYCNYSDWQLSENILERRIGIYLKNDAKAKKISCFVMNYLLSLRCSNTTSAGISFAQLIGQDQPLQHNNTGGLELNEEDESFFSMDEDESRQNLEEFLLRRRNTEQMQMNYGFIYSPYGDGLM